MARITVREDVDLQSPTLVEGLPGVGLVGKIATDHLVEALGMTRYATVDECEGLPPVVTFAGGDRTVRAPVRLYADAERDLLALVSDVPVSASAGGEFARCVTGWLADHDVTPVYLSGRPVGSDGAGSGRGATGGNLPGAGVGSGEDGTTSEASDEGGGDTGEGGPDRALTGVGVGAGESLLDEAGVAPPDEEGVVGGPTGALLRRAAEVGLDAVGLVVESDPRFPDPGAARVLVEDGVAPIADVDVPVAELVERAGEIRAQKQRLAERMQQADVAESSQARPLGMYR